MEEQPEIKMPTSCIERLRGAGGRRRPIPLDAKRINHDGDINAWSSTSFDVFMARTICRHSQTRRYYSIWQHTR